VEHYLSLVDKLRKVKPDIAITTDFIAGFPGETLEEHQETLALLHKVRFDTAFTFYYSERPGTKACDIAGGLSLEERKRRLDEIIETQVEITAEKNQEFIGKRRVILIDGPSKRDPKQWQGRTSDFRMVNFTGVEGIAIGQFVEVEIIDATKFALKGKLL
jgi:tRNA-2-methylthio-N6-dimethylallyladenosine synthase